MNRVTNILNRYADLKEKHIATLTNQHSHKVSQFHKTLKANFGQNLAALQVNQHWVSVGLWIYWTKLTSLPIPSYFNASIKSSLKNIMLIPFFCLNSFCRPCVWATQTSIIFNFYKKLLANNNLKLLMLTLMRKLLLVNINVWYNCPLYRLPFVKVAARTPKMLKPVLLATLLNIWKLWRKCKVQNTFNDRKFIEISVDWISCLCRKLISSNSLSFTGYSISNASICMHHITLQKKKYNLSLS